MRLRRQLLTHVRSYQPALLMSAIPSIAALVHDGMVSVASSCGTTLAAIEARAAEDASIRLFFLPHKGLAALGANALLVSLIWSVIMVASVDRRFDIASAWLAVAVGLCLLGLIHDDIGIDWKTDEFYNMDNDRTRWRVLCALHCCCSLVSSFEYLGLAVVVLGCTS